MGHLSCQFTVSPTGSSASCNNFSVGFQFELLHLTSASFSSVLRPAPKQQSVPKRWRPRHRCFDRHCARPADRVPWTDNWNWQVGKRIHLNTIKKKQKQIMVRYTCISNLKNMALQAKERDYKVVIQGFKSPGRRWMGSMWIKKMSRWRDFVKRDGSLNRPVYKQPF